MPQPPSDVVEALDALAPGRVFRSAPAVPDDVHVLDDELGGNLPDDVVDLLSWSDGLGIAGLPVGFYLPNTVGLRGLNGDDLYRERLPGMVVVADDGGTGLFVADPDGRLPGGRGAVYLVDRGDLDLAEAHLAGGSVTDVVRSVLAGADLWQRPIARDLAD
jgi:hypothetical protein